MRSFAFILTISLVIGLAFWAYQVNYQTQRAISESEALQRQIGDARSRLAILRAEWAYLNRPDRLRDLAEINFDRLGLLPLRPYQFGKIDQVGYPPVEPAMMPIVEPIELSSDGASDP